MLYAIRFPIRVIRLSRPVCGSFQYGAPGYPEHYEAHLSERHARLPDRYCMRHSSLYKVPGYPVSGTIFSTGHAVLYAVQFPVRFMVCPLRLGAHIGRQYRPIPGHRTWGARFRTRRLAGMQHHVVELRHISARVGHSDWWVISLKMEQCVDWLDDLFKLLHFFCHSPIISMPSMCNIFPKKKIVEL